MYVFYWRFEKQGNNLKRLKGRWFYIFHAPKAYLVDDENRFWVPSPSVGWYHAEK